MTPTADHKPLIERISERIKRFEHLRLNPDEFGYLDATLILDILESSRTALATLLEKPLPADLQSQIADFQKLLHELKVKAVEKVMGQASYEELAEVEGKLLKMFTEDKLFGSLEPKPIEPGELEDLIKKGEELADGLCNQHDTKSAIIIEKLLLKLTILHDKLERKEEERKLVLNKLYRYQSETYADETIIDDIIKLLNGEPNDK